MELISIIVPVYRVEPYLDACVESIVCQTYRNLEIILVDDGSPDRCCAMCDDWAARDSRIKVIHKENGGAASARNAGLNAAQGTYIGFVDSDDMIRPDMYELLWNSIHNSGKKIACCFHGWIPGAPYEPEVPKTQVLDVEETVGSILTRQVGTSVWRRLYHRSVWEGLRFPEGEINEDYPMLVPTAVAAGGMVVVQAELYFYRETENSVTSAYWKNGIQVILKNLNLINSQIEKNHLNCRPQFREFTIRTLYSAGIMLDKHLPELSDQVRIDHKQCIRLMRKLLFYAVFGKALSLKDKILYCMIVARILRPTYTMMRRM